MNRSKKRGTSWESAIVQFLKEHGVVHAERRALNGATDRGDIAGIPGLVIEAKSTKSLTLAAFVKETEAERVNDGARHGVAWVKRVGKSSPADAYVVMTGDGLMRLLADAGYVPYADGTDA